MKSLFVTSRSRCSSKSIGTYVSSGVICARYKVILVGDLRLSKVPSNFSMSSCPSVSTLMSGFQVLNGEFWPTKSDVFVPKNKLSALRPFLDSLCDPIESDTCVEWKLLGEPDERTASLFMFEGANWSLNVAWEILRLLKAFILILLRRTIGGSKLSITSECLRGSGSRVFYCLRFTGSPISGFFIWKGWTLGVSYSFSCV